MAKHKIEYFRGTEDLPIKRFHRFNKYLMKEAEVGSDYEDLMGRIGTLSKYIQHDLKEKAIAELSNMELCIFNALNEVDPKSMAHAVMVKSIDGKEQKDMSEERLSEIAEMLGEQFTKGELDEKVDELKKK
jgi:hypothetical protein